MQLKESVNYLKLVWGYGGVLVINVEIRRPRVEDIKQFKKFFSIVIKDTFYKEGIGEKLNDMKDEIIGKENYLESDFESNGEKRFFLIALVEEKIVFQAHGKIGMHFLKVASFLPHPVKSTFYHYI